MKVKSLFALLCALTAGGACAVDYEWVGGASSGARWSEPSNWRPSTGCPGAGDTAYFPVSVTIDDDFQIADGVLCITNAPGTALELKGVISGSGGILKKGGGAIAFWGSNTFSGGFSAGGADGGGGDETYNGKTLKCNAECGIVALRNGSGFGTAKATVNTSLYIDAAGGMEITSPIAKGSDTGRQLYVAGSGNAVFKESVEFTAKNTHIGMQHETSAVRFEKDVTVNNGNGWISNGGGYGGTVVFESNLICPSGGLSFSLSRLHFYGGANSFGTLDIQTHVSFHAKNSISRINLLRFDKTGGILDLCGVDQTMAGGQILFTSNDISGYEIRSSAPAQLVLNKAVSISGVFRGRFTGMAGLYCSPDAEDSSRIFAISDFVQPTRGTFTMAGMDHLALRNGAGFSSLGKLELKKNNAAVDIDATASDIRIDEMNVTWKWNRVNIAQGRKIECRKLTFGAKEVPTGVYAYTYGTDAGFESSESGGIIVNSALPAMPQIDNYYLGKEDGDWNDPGNWSAGTVPAAGDRLSIRFGSLRLSGSTPVYGDVELVNSTVICKGWNTKLSTANLTVGEGAVVTCEGPFTNGADKARVWISCANLTVEKGGRIDVTKKGWSCGIATNGVVNVPGYGPGAGRQGTGASHGGPGGKTPNPRDYVKAGHSPCYGSESRPEEPGSGGHQDISGAVGACTHTHGGGVVRIEASGTVTVDGHVLANGGSVKYAGTPLCTSDSPDSAGSGGSIWITCSRFAGSGGTVEAKGGDGSEPCYPKWRWGVGGKVHPAGGGRIAIDYGEGQLASDLVDMTVSACAGLHTGTSGYFTGAKAEGEVLPLAMQDSFRNSAELGSVWFTDGKLLDALVGDGLYGYVAHPLGYSTKEDLSFTRGWVRFWGEGADIAIGGDLEILGDARLEVGGAWYTNRVADVSMAGIYAGDTPVKFSVGGNMTVTGGGRFDIRPAGTAGEDGWGAIVSVAGSLLVGEGGRMVPWCDVHTGTAAKFSVAGDFAVDAGGLVTADGLGYGSALNWAGYENLGKSNKGFGPGAGTDCGAGGHGGAGGIGYRNGSHNGTPGGTYGDEYVPVEPGSGGGGYGYGITGNGGGVIYIDAGGTLRVDGTVSANGATSVDESQYVAWNASGAGGSVCLRGRSMSGSGTVSADGGAGRQAQYTDGNGTPTLGVSGSGGGGRVSIWTGLAYTPDATVVRSRNPVADWDFAFTGVISASGGGNCFAYDTTDDVRAIEMPATARGEDGTVRFCYARKVGFSVTFR